MPASVNEPLRRQFALRFACALAGLPCAALAAAGDAAGDATGDRVQVTATRVPESIDRLPVDLSIVPAAQLSALGASDLAGALRLVPGVEAPAGGDAGPSSAVPSFWGLHEFDAFLLLVDGVPWGGAFNPMITSLNLHDTERVEVLKGPAPVMYGATSFVGVVQVLHWPAGQASQSASLMVGSHDSRRGAAAFALPSLGEYRQSLAVDAQSLGFTDPRETVADQHLLYRGAIDTAAGTLRFDLDASRTRDAPPSPVLRAGSALSALTPVDANFNPADAAIDQDQTHLSVGLSRQTGWGLWESLVSLAHTNVTDIRGFLHPDESGTADTQHQRRRIDDGYLDTHATFHPAEGATLVAGADLLFGLARQTTLNANDAYTVPLDGSALPPSTAQLPVDETGTLRDRRIFAGEYVQVDWAAHPGWDLLAGLRMNQTDEHKQSSDQVDPPSDSLSDDQSRRVGRLSGTLGASVEAWRAGEDRMVLFADYRDAFKPSAIDFGPDYTPQVLLPETAQSIAGGVKGALDGGHLSFGVSAFDQAFSNLVVATTSGALANAARERLRGVDAELRYRATGGLEWVVTAAYHDARFTQYTVVDGDTAVDVAGRQLPLSPHVLASAGWVYGQQGPLTASLTLSHVGRRYLDEENTAPVGSYTTLDATLGWRFGRATITLQGTNLSDRRAPVIASEFGSQSFYLLPGRRIWLRLGCAV